MHVCVCVRCLKNKEQEQGQEGVIRQQSSSRHAPVQMLEEKLHSDTNITPFGIIIIASCQHLHLRCQALPCLCLSVKSQPAVDIHICKRTHSRTHTRTLVQEFSHIYHAAKLLLRHAARIDVRDAALRHSSSLDQRFDFQKNKKACGRGNREVNRCPTRRQGTVAQRRSASLAQRRG